MRENLKNRRNPSHQISENFWKIAKFCHIFDILVFSKCILYFDILVVFRILILKFSRIRSQITKAWLELAARLSTQLASHRPSLLFILRSLKFDEELAGNLDDSQAE